MSPMTNMLAARAKKMARNQARAMALKAQNQAKQYAVRKAQQVANAAKRRVNAGITGLVNKHMGNSPQARAMANQLKAHVTNKINMAHTITKNQIKAAPAVRLF